MNFFEQQKLARARTHKLVFLLAVSLTFLTGAFYCAVQTALTFYTFNNHATIYSSEHLASTWDPRVFLACLCAVVGMVGATSLYKRAMLLKGGSAVAESLGGKLLSPVNLTPAERRLLNVVEEMAIASGVRVPQVYILEEDSGINAFAAGFSTNEAVIGITRGTIERLSREELQGVIAHEFSHILNGDMRLNLRLIVLVHGLIFLSLVGEFVLRNIGRSRSRSSSNSKGSGGQIVIVIFLVGLALWALGSLGSFCARIIKASISRQREFLADASAVQFTRNPNGVAGALKRILYGAQSDTISSPRGEEVSHMLFSHENSGFFSGLLATHPPLPVRIARIDPSFREDEVTQATFAGAAPENNEEEALVSGLSSPQPTGTTRAAIVESIGTLEPDHLDHASAILRSIPNPLLVAAREVRSAPALIYALIATNQKATQELEATALQKSASEETVAALKELVTQLPLEQRFPLLQLALGAVSSMDRPSCQVLWSTVTELVKADGEVSFFELALILMVRNAIERRLGSQSPLAARYFSIEEVRAPLMLVLSRLAEAGSGDPTEQNAALIAATQGLSDFNKLPEEPIDVNKVSEALMQLRVAAAELKEEVVTRLSHATLADNAITIEEAELFRAVCSTLEVPVPPFLG